MRLDRALQLEVLQRLENFHPFPIDETSANEFRSKYGEPILVSNLLYMEGHGLIHSGVAIKGYDYTWDVDSMQITYKGRDFLANDGGLSAILDVVTFKFHEETLKALIAQKIEESEASPSDKRKWIDALRQLPAETTKHLTMKLIDLALLKSPEALHAIQTALSSFHI